MFTRPDTGGTPTSYPAPTWSSAKAILESIAFLADGSAWICPTKTEICRGVKAPGGKVRFQRWTTNYGGPLRKGQLISKGDNMQVFATVLREVCYRLHAEIRGKRAKCHYLHDLFNRRLSQGRCHRTPFLGLSEFTCSYWGLERTGVTEVDRDLSLTIPSMLLSVWQEPVGDKNAGAKYLPTFRQNMQITSGVLIYDSVEDEDMGASKAGGSDA